MNKNFRTGIRGLLKNLTEKMKNCDTPQYWQGPDLNNTNYCMLT